MTDTFDLPVCGAGCAGFCAAVTAAALAVLAGVLPGQLDPETVRQTLDRAGAIVPGATAELTIPLGSFPTRGGGTHLTVTTTGMGPQVISTPTFALDFRAK